MAERLWHECMQRRALASTRPGATSALRQPYRQPNRRARQAKGGPARPARARDIRRPVPGLRAVMVSSYVAIGNYSNGRGQ